MKIGRANGKKSPVVISPTKIEKWAWSEIRIESFEVLVTVPDRECLWCKCRVDSFPFVSLKRYIFSRFEVKDQSSANINIYLLRLTQLSPCFRLMLARRFRICDRICFHISNDIFLSELWFGEKRWWIIAGLKECTRFSEICNISSTLHKISIFNVYVHPTHS